MSDFVNEGWAIPGSAKKAHYFRRGQSLCRRWMFLGSIYADEQLSVKQLPDDCKACWNVRDKEVSSSGSAK